jgi:vacuolar-type H+-ATPase subunit H
MLIPFIYLKNLFNFDNLLFLNSVNETNKNKIENVKNENREITYQDEKDFKVVNDSISNDENVTYIKNNEKIIDNNENKIKKVESFNDLASDNSFDLGSDYFNSDYESDDEKDDIF